MIVSLAAKAYHLDGFMFPRHRLLEARNIDGKRILRTELPFISLFRFRHDLRVVEFENLPIFIGLILHRMSVDGTGFTLAGPAYAPPGEPFKGISAWYPRPDLQHDGKSFLEGAKSLNYSAGGPAAEGGKAASSDEVHNVATPGTNRSDIAQIAPNSAPESYLRRIPGIASKVCLSLRLFREASGKSFRRRRTRAVSRLP